MNSVFNSRVVYDAPLRVCRPLSWIGHAPFAFFAVESLAPKNIVELGTHSGNSYNAFCQVVKKLGLPARCFAVDTWEGDPQAGFHDPLVYRELVAHQAEHYAEFSTLLRATFDEARERFQDASVDLLHIDGLHTYDAVRHDFTTWLPKVCPKRGVILFHDVAVTRDDFGVWRFFGELRETYPQTAAFSHCNGLGILVLGNEVPEAFLELIREMNASEACQRFFEALGDRVIERFERDNDMLPRPVDKARLYCDPGSGFAEQPLLEAEVREGPQQARFELGGLRLAAVRFDPANRPVRLRLKELLFDRTAFDPEGLLREDNAFARENGKLSFTTDDPWMVFEIPEAVRDRPVESLTLRFDLEVLGEAAKSDLFDGLAGERDRLAGDLEVCRYDLDENRLRLAQMENSLSWRLTSPLRRLTRVAPRASDLASRLLVRSARLALAGARNLRDLPRLARGLSAPRRPGPPRLEENPALLVGGERGGVAKERFPDPFALRSKKASARLAVVLHLYYSDLWDEIRGLLENIEEDYDLYVSLTAGVSEECAEIIEKTHPGAVVWIFPNHGRDICPFVYFVNEGVFNQYDAVCKIHSKKSLRIEDGEAWRKELFSGILGSRERVRDIVDLLRRDPDLGMVAPDGNILGPGHWGSCRERTEELLSWLELRPDPDTLRFAAGSMFWIKPFALRQLQSLALTPDDFEREAGQIDGTTAHAVERFLGVACRAGAMDLIAADEVAARLNRVRGAAATRRFRPKLVAFYLPQFHPIPENDRWWGKGFTEWNNVTRARPMFLGHEQPRLPGELGFYDLRLDAVREEQANLAAAYGLHGFCYYYYWFNGKALLDLPLRALLSSGRPQFPFCLCWANENWTRSWDGHNADVLLRQHYTMEGCLRFIRDVIPMMRDERYVRFEGRPVFVVYRIRQIPRYREVMELWREECRRSGLGEIRLGAVQFPEEDLEGPPADHGVDAYVDFPPHNIRKDRIERNVPELDPAFKGIVYTYDGVVEGDLARYAKGYAHPLHRGLMLGWDNTARRMENAHICHGANPAKFRRWLRGVVDQEERFNPASESLVFINAWNEWAEGTILEPGRRFGRGYLEAAASVSPAEDA